MSKYIHARTAVYNVGYHLVWSTKYRRAVLTGSVEATLKALLHENVELPASPIFNKENTVPASNFLIQFIERKRY